MSQESAADAVRVVIPMPYRMHLSISDGDRVIDSPALPRDVHELAAWFNVIRRAISVAHSGGYAIVTMRVIVDADGKPQFWIEPELTRIEPKRDTETLKLFLQGLDNRA